MIDEESINRLSQLADAIDAESERHNKTIGGFEDDLWRTKIQVVAWTEPFDLKFREYEKASIEIGFMRANERWSICWRQDGELKGALRSAPCIVRALCIPKLPDLLLAIEKQAQTLADAMESVP
jgi:hypothetical protein